MAIEPIMFRTAGDASAIVCTIREALASLGYAVAPHPDGWGGRAEVGSAAARFLAGGFARRMIIDFRLIPGDRIGATEVAITPATTGMSGGLMGVGKAKKEMQSIYQAVGSALGRSGLLAG